MDGHLELQSWKFLKGRTVLFLSLIEFHGTKMEWKDDWGNRFVSKKTLAQRWIK